MVLVQKRPFFQLLFFKQYRPGKFFLGYSRTKKERLARLLNQEVPKFETLQFSQRG